jgi:hypothetical protein
MSAIGLARSLTVLKSNNDANTYLLGAENALPYTLSQSQTKACLWLDVRGK